MYSCIIRETFVFTVFRRVFHSILKLELCRHACRRRDQIIPTCRYGKNMPTTALIISDHACCAPTELRRTAHSRGFPAQINSRFVYFSCRRIRQFRVLVKMLRKHNRNDCNVKSNIMCIGNGYSLNKKYACFQLFL